MEESQERLETALEEISNSSREIEGQIIFGDSFQIEEYEISENYLDGFSSVKVFRQNQQILDDIIFVFELSEEQINSIEEKSGSDAFDALNNLNSSANELTEKVPSLSNESPAPIIWWKAEELKESLVNEEKVLEIFDQNSELFEKYQVNLDREVYPACLNEFRLILQNHSVVSPYKGFTVLEFSENSRPVGGSNLPSDVFSKTSLRLNHLYRALSWGEKRLEDLESFSQMTRGIKYIQGSNLFDKRQEWIDTSTKIREETSKIESVKNVFNFEAEEQKTLSDEIPLTKYDEKPKGLYSDFLDNVNRHIESVDSNLTRIQRNFDSISDYHNERVNTGLQFWIFVLTMVLLASEFLSFPTTQIGKMEIATALTIAILGYFGFSKIKERIKGI